MMLPDWPRENKGYCFIMQQLAKRRRPRCYTGILKVVIVASGNYRCKIIHVIYPRKALNTRKPKVITFFASRQMDHNKIDTLHLVWAVTSEQMKITAKFFLPGTWCHSFLLFETQSTVKKEVLINVAMCTILAHFSKNCLFKNCLSGSNNVIVMGQF